MGAQLVLALLLDRGDPLLVEEYTYSHILESVAEPKGYRPVGVPIDRDGIVPAGLRQVCCAHRPLQTFRQSLASIEVEYAHHLNVMSFQIEDSSCWSVSMGVGALLSGGHLALPLTTPAVVGSGSMTAF